MRAANEFLKRINMHPDLIDLEKATGVFCSEIEKGIGLEGGSSLPMIPAFANALPGSALRGKVAVVDAGGTNLRAYLVEFSDNGPAILDSAAAAMPGREHPISFKEYCDTVAKLLQPFYHRADCLGYCFSFVAVALPGGDAELRNFNKEIVIQAEPGTLLCQSLFASLQQLGEEPKPYSLVNDSVAAMLAVPAVTGSAMRSSAGFILGTGHNVCYAEKSENIKKSPEAVAMGGYMAVNMESACFDKLVRGEADIMLDAASAAPGDHLLEKMVAGAYFGQVLRGCVSIAAGEGLFEDVSAIGPIETKDASLISEGNNIYGLSAGDFRLLQGMSLLLAERAGKAVSLPLLAAHRRSCPDGRLVVAAEGSTVNKFGAIKRYLEQNLGGRAVLLNIENATVLGTAAAALTRKNNF